MRLPLYVLFSTAAMLSALVTCQTLSDAVKLRSVAKAYLYDKIELDVVILTLDNMLSTLDPPYQLHTPRPDDDHNLNLVLLGSGGGEGFMNSMMFRDLMHFLNHRQDWTQTGRIFYDSANAIYMKIMHRPQDGLRCLKISITDDMQEGLSHQPIMNALELRYSVEAYIDRSVKISVAVAKLAKLVHMITKYKKCDIAGLFSSLNLESDIADSFNLLNLGDDPAEDSAGDSDEELTCDIAEDKQCETSEEMACDIAEDKPCDTIQSFVVTLSNECSNIVTNHPERCQNGTQAQRIATESMAAFLQYYNRNPDGARNLLDESISNDDDVKITGELIVGAPGPNPE
jgi:hypothetical protein